jgi:hypothetical protein
MLRLHMCLVKALVWLVYRHFTQHLGALSETIILRTVYLYRPQVTDYLFLLSKIGTTDAGDHSTRLNPRAVLRLVAR